VKSSLLFLIISFSCVQQGFCQIDSYFFWGGTDDVDCYAEAHGSATGAPNIWLYLTCDSGLASKQIQSPSIFTDTVQLKSSNYFSSGYHAPRFGGDVSVFVESVTIDMTRMVLDCSGPTVNGDPCATILRKHGIVGAGSDCDSHSPIVIDLAQDGFQFGAPGEGVAFDLYGTGQPIYLQWVAIGGDEAFLFRDINGNGIADDGSELFGNGTVLIDGSLAPNGFVALAEFDSPLLGGNDDVFVTAEDAVWSELGLWLDSDADGISTSYEILSLAEIGISRLQIIPWVRNSRDDADNLLRFWAWAYVDGSLNVKYEMVDVFFKELDR